jgi:hypothetical protein
VAQFYTTFAEYTMGQAPSDWTIRWVTANQTWAVREKTGLIGDRVLEHTATAATQPRRAITWNAAGSPANAEILARVRVSDEVPWDPATLSQNRVQVRVSGGSGSESAYYLEYRLEGGGQARLSKLVGGTFTSLGLQNFAWRASNLLWLRLRAQGTQIMGKFWRDGAAEPSHWQFNVTDTSLTSGAVGVGALNFQGIRDFDFVGIGTAGDAAPTPDRALTGFGEYPTGVQPHDWTLRWVTGNQTWAIREKGNAIGDKVLEHQSPEAARRLITWNRFGSNVRDVEVVSKMRSGTTDANQNRVYVRASGPAGSESAYFTELFGSLGAGVGSQFRIRKQVNGPISTIGTASFTWHANTWYWVRFRVVGNRLRAKVWADGTSEPSSWMINVTDNDLTQGWVGVGTFTAQNIGEPIATRDFDFFGVATHGLNAPRLPQVTVATNFANYTSGHPPIDWTARMGNATEWQVLVDPSPGVTGGKVMRHDAVGDGDKALTWNVADHSGPIEVLAKVKAAAGGAISRQPAVILRASGAMPAANFYALTFRTPDLVDIVAFENGSQVRPFLTELRNFPRTIGNWYWMRFRADGPVLRGRVWPDGASEPSDWQLETVDTRFSAGWAGVGSLPEYVFPTFPTGHATYTLAEGQIWQNTAHVFTSPNSGPTMVMGFGIHGREVAGTRVVENVFLPQMINGQRQINRGRLVIVPRLMSPGIVTTDPSLVFTLNTRGFGDILDLNRVFATEPTHRYSAEVDAFYRHFNPVYVWDSHEAGDCWHTNPGAGGVFVGNTIISQWSSQNQPIIDRLNNEHPSACVWTHIGPPVAGSLCRRMTQFGIVNGLFETAITISGSPVAASTRDTRQLAAIEYLLEHWNLVD